MRARFWARLEAVRREAVGLGWAVGDTWGSCLDLLREGREEREDFRRAWHW